MNEMPKQKTKSAFGDAIKSAFGDAIKSAFGDATKSALPLIALFLFSAALLPAQTLQGVLVSKINSSRPPAAAAPLPAQVIQAALSYLGVPYVHAGDSREGMDCSGLVYRVFFDTVGASLPRGVEGLYREGQPTPYPLHLGDLVFFDTRERLPPKVPTHVGVYIGKGRIVHAASEGSRTGVIVSALNDPYYSDRFLGARRVLPWRDPVLDLALTDEKASITEVEPFPSQQDVTIRVFNDMSGGGPVSLSLVKDGTEILSRWIVPGSQKPAEVSFQTGIGRWSIRIARIFKGRTLSDVAFTVVE
jgi:cell wall-associated NlpC family hydrolase